VTAPEQPDPDRPTAADQGALFDAVGAEHAAIYGYGMVSAHSLPIRNDLVSAVLAEHRDRREAAIPAPFDHGIERRGIAGRIGLGNRVKFKLGHSRQLLLGGRG
jgi:hypothetical protein